MPFQSIVLRRGSSPKGIRIAVGLMQPSRSVFCKISNSWKTTSRNICRLEVYLELQLG
jgi:hypothetical protein